MASGSLLASTDQNRDLRSSSSEMSRMASSAVHPRSSAMSSRGRSTRSGCDADSATDTDAQLNGKSPSPPERSSHVAARHAGSR